MFKMFNISAFQKFLCKIKVSGEQTLEEHDQFWCSFGNYFNSNVNFWCLIVLLALVGFYYVKIYLSGGVLWKSGLKGPPPLPFVGCAYLNRRADDLHKLLHQGIKLYGKTYIYWKGFTPFVVTSDLEIIQKVLSDPKHTEKTSTYKSFHFFMGHGVLTAPVEKWKQDRKALLPGVKSPALYNSVFLPSFNKNSKILVDILKEKFPISCGNEMEIFKDLGRCTMQIVFETLMDAKVDIQRHPELNWVEAGLACSELTRIKMFHPWISNGILWKLSGYSKIQEENMEIVRKSFEDLMKEIDQRRAKDPADDKPQKCMDLLKLHFGNDEQQILSQFTTLIGAGFETTSTVLNHTLFLLANNPKVQAILLEEVDSVFKGDFERDATLEDLPDLKYMDSVLKESMRIMTPTPLLGRVLGADLHFGKGKIIPKGCQISIAPWEVHHDPEIYENPKEFIPERWSVENSGRNIYSFLPFSGGPRACFGQKYAMMEMKIILSQIIGNFEISSSLKTSDVRFRFGIVSHPIGGMPLTLKQRNKLI